MAKSTNSIAFKGFLDVDFGDAKGTLEEVSKDESRVYDIIHHLKKFNGKNVRLSIAEDDEPETIDEA